MEFELMIPFGVVIIIFATIICRKYIFIKKSDEDIITCDEGEDKEIMMIILGVWKKV